MKSIKIKHHTPEWKEWRKENGFGGSEIASVCATKSELIADLVYIPPLKLYLDKIQEPVQEFTGNIASEGGHFFEPIILDWFRHWDLNEPDQMIMFDNIKNKRRVNKIIAQKKTFYNDEYPFLYNSPDAFFYKEGNKYAHVECKMTTSMEANRYTNRVNPSYVLQVQQGMLISGIPKAYICMIVDGKWFEVIEIDASEAQQKFIIETSSALWLKILQARKLKLEYGIDRYYGINPDFLSKEQREGAELLLQLEPEFTGTNHEYDFIKEMFVPTEEYTEMQGTSEQWDLGLKYHDINSQLKTLSKEKSKISQGLIKSLGGYHEAKFDEGHINYKRDSRGISKIYVSPKIKEYEE